MNLSSVHISMTMKTPMRSRKSGRRTRSMTPPLAAFVQTDCCEKLWPHCSRVSFASVFGARARFSTTPRVTFCPLPPNLLSRSRFRDPQPERSDYEPIRIGCFDLINRSGACPGDPGVARPGAGQDGYEQDAAGREGQHGTDGEEQAREVLRHQRGGEERLR